MLIQCPECNLQVSDMAAACPHCGCPVEKMAGEPRKKSKANKKRMRLPNGFGQISELKGRRLRNPFRVLITVGKTPEGRPICKPLKPRAYFPTYNDAYAALVEHSKNPYDISMDITVEELYEKWSEEYFKTIKSSTHIKSAWKYCSSVYKMKVKDLHIRHIKHCIYEGTIIKNGKEQKAPFSMRKPIKNMFNMMLDYALEYEIVDKNYARNFTIDNFPSIKEHIAFTDEEFQLICDNVNIIPYADIVIIHCYSGWRPQELEFLELKNVDLKAGFFKGGMKTKAGKDRIVPIHSRIMPFVQKRYEEAKSLGSKYLFCYKGQPAKGTALTYSRYKKIFYDVINTLDLNPNHRPHDCRKQFVTMAKKYKVDEYAIKYMVGHYIGDLTENVYTSRDPEWLKEEIEKIK